MFSDATRAGAAQAGVEAGELADGAEEGGGAEELGGAVEAVVVADGNFGGAEAAPFELGDKLHADGAAGGGEAEAGQEVAADQAEVAVDVCQVQAERAADGAAIEVAENAAMDGVAAALLVAVHPAAGVRRSLHQEREIAEVVLGVAVGVEDPVFRGASEAGSQGGAVALVSLVRDDAEPGAVAGFEILENLGGVVAAAIVHDDDFEVAGALRNDVERRRDEARQRRGVVEGGKEDRKRAGQLHGLLSRQRRRAGAGESGGRTWPGAHRRRMRAAC